MHTLVIELDSIEQAKLDAGEFVFPEHTDSRDWHIRCDDPKNCIGWQECLRDHTCPHGIEASHGFDEDSHDGNCPGHDDPQRPNCFAGEEVFTFHGIDHTWRWGWGWTVPYIGCIVATNFDGDVYPHGIDAIPIGEHPVDEDWYDESDVSLTLASAA